MVGSKFCACTSAYSRICGLCGGWVSGSGSWWLEIQTHVAWVIYNATGPTEQHEFISQRNLRADTILGSMYLRSVLCAPPRCDGAAGKNVCSQPDGRAYLWDSIWTRVVMLI